MSHAPTFALIAALAASSSALAGIEAEFIESAPKDRFSFTNTGGCDIGPATLTVTLTGLAPAQSVAFTIDVDDTLRHSALGQIQVTDSEAAGATLIVETASGTSIGVFDNTSRARITLPDCTS